MQYVAAYQVISFVVLCYNQEQEEKVMIVIGVDPDSEAHGIAIYREGKLEQLEKWNISALITFLSGQDDLSKILFSIENVMKNQFVYARNRHGSKSAQSKIAMHIGRCQQSQVEFQRVLSHFGVRFVLHPPQKNNWADTKLKPHFEKVTGWKGRSNSDCRSAAFFGYLALSNRQRALCL
jgi:hypothetical protein